MVFTQIAADWGFGVQFLDLVPVFLAGRLSLILFF